MSLPTFSAAARARSGLRWALALLFVGAGVAHFVIPGPFEGVVPAWVPDARAAVWLSGLAEVAGGLGLLHPRTRRAATWGLVALLVAVFPANLGMALEARRFPFPEWVLWARLPLQPLLIAGVLWAGGVLERASNKKSPSAWEGDTGKRQV